MPAKVKYCDLCDLIIYRVLFNQLDIHIFPEKSRFARL